MEHRLEREAGESDEPARPGRYVGYLSAVLVGIVLVSAAADAFEYPAARAPIAAVDLAAAAAVVALWLAWGRRAPRRVDGYVCALAWVAAADTLGCMAIVRDPMLTTHVVLEIVAVGSLVSSLRWAGSTIAIVAPAAMAVLSSLRLPVPLAQYAVGLFGASVIALVIVATRARDLARLARTRRAEKDALRAAEQARSAAERELEARKRTEEERESLRGQFVHAQKMEAIGVLAGGVAHDVNNSLCAIVSLAQVIRDEAKDPTLRADADQILAAAKRSSQLTADLLRFGRRGAPSRRQPLRLERVVANVHELVSRTARKDIHVTTELPAAPVVVLGEGPEITQALVNLCLNAIEATPGAGTVALACDRVQVDAVGGARLGVPPGPYARVRVEDEGTGMDEATRLRIFEPFFTTKEPGKGTGLGLPLVWSTAVSHGGAVEADSAVGEGTKFTMYFPIAEVTAVPSSFPPAPRRREAVARRVLLVDDEPIVRRALRRVLERLGYAVEDVGGGAEAVAHLRAGEVFDLVLLDVSMPEMSGVDCLREVRELRPHQPVLMMTGHAADAEYERLTALGARGVVAKPFSHGELDEAILRVLAPPARAEDADDAAG